MQARHQKLPASGHAREALRQKGQFWTPQWVAEAMVAYVVSSGSSSIFDPAVGEGAFFRAAKAVASTIGRTITLSGTEIDQNALQQARTTELDEGDLTGVQMRDFILDPPDGPFSAIVANPPYIRHHRLPSETKALVRELGRGLIGVPLDGRAGLHVYFLLRALQRLGTGGRLAFIMPADTCEGVFADTLWRWITTHYRLDAVVTFSPDASPFPGVDTNALIFLISNCPPDETFLWARVCEAGTEHLRSWVLSRFAETSADSLVVVERLLSEGIRTGLSRPPRDSEWQGPVLGDYARVMRGIATGDNDFFFLTRERADALCIPSQFLKTAVGRTRDIEGEVITEDTIAALDAAGRPTLLLSLGSSSPEQFPAKLRAYLEHGEDIGLPSRALISMRRPWYRMEEREAPPLLFAYLGRRNARFVRNKADVRPLTGFLCVYPRASDPEQIDKLWAVLRHPETVANLSLVGKSYGDGAIKVEPRSLEKLPLPTTVLEQVGLSWSGSQAACGVAPPHHPTKTRRSAQHTIPLALDW